MKIPVFNIIKQLILKPKLFWQSRKETEINGSLFVSYLFPIIVLVAIAVFIGEFFSRSDFFIQYPLLKALREFLLFVFLYFVSVFFTNQLMSTFGAEKNIRVARKLVAYSITPYLLVSLIAGLFPFLYPVVILGFYGFYVFVIGVKELLTFPDNRRQSYILITILVNFLVFGFINVFLSKLLAAFC